MGSAFGSLGGCQAAAVVVVIVSKGIEAVGEGSAAVIAGFAVADSSSEGGRVVGGVPAFELQAQNWSLQNLRSHLLLKD